MIQVPPRSVGKESTCNAGDPSSIPGLGRFHCGSAGKESACNAGGLGSIPGLGRSPGEGKGYPFLYSGLENSMDYIWYMGSPRVGHDRVTFTIDFPCL